MSVRLFPSEEDPEEDPFDSASPRALSDRFKAHLLTNAEVPSLTEGNYLTTVIKEIWKPLEEGTCA